MNAEIIKLNDNTWRIENGFVRFFLLTGSRRALLIDSGASCPDARETAASLTDLPIELLLTHGDGDHVSGNGAFSEFYIHPEDHVNCHVADRFPDSRIIPINGGETLDLGDRPLEMIAIPGHTYGSIAILDVNSRTLYSGDSVQDGHIFMFGSHRDPEAFAGSLDKLAAMADRFDRIFPSHGTPVLPADYVRTVQNAWQQVLSGAIVPHEESLHGTQVLTYDADGCGFYCHKN